MTDLLLDFGLRTLRFDYLRLHVWDCLLGFNVFVWVLLCCLFVFYGWFTFERFI